MAGEAGPDGELMTEEKVAKLEAQYRELERYAEQVRSAPRNAFPPIFRPESSVGLAEAERLYLVARAQMDRQLRAAADDMAAKTLATNVTMAKASAEAARWAKWAAIFTAVAAGVGLVVSLVTALLQSK